MKRIFFLILMIIFLSTSCDLPSNIIMKNNLSYPIIFKTDSIFFFNTKDGISDSIFYIKENDSVKSFTFVGEPDTSRIPFNWIKIYSLKDTLYLKNKLEIINSLVTKKYGIYYLDVFAPTERTATELSK